MFQRLLLKKKMKLSTLFFAIIILLEFITIYLIDNPENYNPKIFITLVIQIICLYELKKSDDKIMKFEKRYNV